MIGSLRFGVTDEGFAVLAPVLRLPKPVSTANTQISYIERTVDFQYSDMVGKIKSWRGVQHADRCLD